MNFKNLKLGEIKGNMVHVGDGCLISLKLFQRVQIPTHLKVGDIVDIPTIGKAIVGIESEVDKDNFITVYYGRKNSSCRASISYDKDIISKTEVIGNIFE